MTINYNGFKYTPPNSGYTGNDTVIIFYQDQLSAEFGQVSLTLSVMGASTVPGAPTNVNATPGNASASVSFSAPASNGGAAITGYTVVANPGGATAIGASSPIVITSLNNGTAYTFTVNATNSAGTGPASAQSTVVIPKATQSITFNNPGSQNFGTTPMLSATASSTLPVTFSSATTGVCTISGSTLTLVTAGSCTVNANQAGNESTVSAPQVSHTFAVNAVVPSAPTIGVATAGDTQASVAFTPPTNTGGTVIDSYAVTVNPPDVAPVNGSSSPIVVTGLTNGQTYTFTLTATNSAGTGGVSAVSNSVTPKASQTITFANPGAQSFGTTPSLTAMASSSLPVSYTSTTPSVCMITTGGMLTFISSGSCTINADQAGDGVYLVAPQVSQTFTVNAVVPGAPASVVATAGNTQATVSWTAAVSNGGAFITGYRVQVATASGGVYTDAAGTCAYATTGTSAAVTCTATDLTNGIEYFFKVAAINSAGTGSYSTASLGVTPVAPAINGACGSSANVVTAFLPTTNLCGAGTASTVTPGRSSWAWSCTGTGQGATNATCSATYPPVTIGGGTVGALLTPGTNGWQINQAASGFVALPAPAPAGITFPGGATKVELNSGIAGTSTTVTLRFSSIPAGAQLFKYGKENGVGDTDKWFAYPATIDVTAGTVTYTLTDGQRGDNDWTANGVIDDPVGLGVRGGDASIAGVPALSQWGMILLAGLMSLAIFVTLRRRTE